MNQFVEGIGERLERRRIDRLQCWHRQLHQGQAVLGGERGQAGLKVGDRVKGVASCVTCDPGELHFSCRRI